MLQVLLTFGIKRLKDHPIDMTSEDLIHPKLNKDSIRMMIMQRMTIMKRNSVDLYSPIIPKKTVII